MVKCWKDFKYYIKIECLGMDIRRLTLGHQIYARRCFQLNQLAAKWCIALVSASSLISPVAMAISIVSI